MSSTSKGTKQTETEEGVKQTHRQQQPRPRTQQSQQQQHRQSPHQSQSSHSSSNGSKKRSRQEWREREEWNKSQCQQLAARMASMKSGGDQESGESSSDSDFLLSGQEKREKQARKEEQRRKLEAATTTGTIKDTATTYSSAISTATSSSSSSLPPPLAGFHYDPKRKKYFKLLAPEVYPFDVDHSHDEEDEEEENFMKSIHRRGRFDTHAKKKQSDLKFLKSASHCPSSIPCVLSPSHGVIGSRSVLQHLLAREYYSRLSPAAIIRSCLPRLLQPTGIFPLFQSCFQTNQRGTHVEYDHYPTADQAIDYDATSCILSVCGKRVYTDQNESNVGGSTYASYLLRENSPIDSRPSVRQPFHSSKLQSQSSLPFQFHTIGWSRTDSSPLTSFHRIREWPILPRSALLPGMSIFSHIVAERRYLAYEARDIWQPEPNETAYHRPVANLMGATYLGGQTGPGSFTMAFFEDTPDGTNWHEVFRYRLTNGSVFTSAFPRSVLEGHIHADALKVSLGTTRGGLILDLMTGKRTHLIQTNRSDIRAQTWLQHGNSDTNELLNGSRDGSIRLFDTRIGAAASSFSSSCSANQLKIKMPSSICWLKQLQTHPDHVMGAAMDGTVSVTNRVRICLYDLRRSSTSSSPPLLAYPGQINSFTELQPELNANEDWLFCSGEDGLIRAWDMRTTELLFARSPVSADFSLPTQPSTHRPTTNSDATTTSAVSSQKSRRPSSIIWTKLKYLDEFRTLIVGSEYGLTAMTMERTDERHRN